MYTYNIFILWQCSVYSVSPSSTQSQNRCLLSDCPLLHYLSHRQEVLQCCEGKATYFLFLNSLLLPPLFSSSLFLFLFPSPSSFLLLLSQVAGCIVLQPSRKHNLKMYVNKSVAFWVCFKPLWAGQNCPWIPMIPCIVAVMLVNEATAIMSVFFHVFISMTAHVSNLVHKFKLLKLWDFVLMRLLLVESLICWCVAWRKIE